MSGNQLMPLAHPLGEQSEREAAGPSVVLDTFAGRVHVEWEPAAPVTALGHLPFFIEFLKQGGLFDNWVAACPLHYTSPNAPKKRDVLGTMVLSILAGHWRYAHITAVRGDGVNPGLLGMERVVSEDAVRRALKKMPETDAEVWLRRHLDETTLPALGGLLDRLGRDRWPWLLRGDADFGTERIMSRAEQEGMPYLFKLRSTRNVKRLIEKAMGEADWTAAGQGWQGKASTLRLQGWSRHRRVVILRRRLAREVLVTDQPGGPAPQLALSFAAVTDDRAVYEYAVLVTALDLEVLSVAQLYRDRADAENGFDEIKNQWGWGGFTTHDLQRCRVMARCVGLVYNWWSLFGRLADPDRRMEAITSRPLLLHGVARRTRHAGQTTLIITSAHGSAGKAQAALTRIAAFFAELRSTAEQLTTEQRWYRILSQALVRYLNGSPLRPPPRLVPT